MAVISVEEFRRMVEEQNRKDAAAMKPGHSRSNKTPEHDMQVRCVNWFREKYPEYSNLFFANGNGGYRSQKTAKAMKAEGILSGVPDLTLALPNKTYHSLYIEMKRSSVGKKGQIIGKGKTSERQDEVINALRNAGFKVEICYSFDQFKTIINDYIKER